MRPLLIGFFVCINIHIGYAQWTQQDSIWLQDVLAGKDTIKLNPEFQKAIQDGSFLNQGEPSGKPRLAAPSSIPITKDFSDYIQQEDTSHRKVALKDLPPSVFWWHVFPPSKLIPVHQSIINELRRNPPPRAGGFFDTGQLTSRKAYVHRRNVKRSSTWKNYNNLPTPDVISKRKKFERQQAEAAKADSIRRDSLSQRVSFPPRNESY